MSSVLRVGVLMTRDGAPSFTMCSQLPQLEENHHAPLDNISVMIYNLNKIPTTVKTFLYFISRLSGEKRKSTGKNTSILRPFELN